MQLKSILALALAGTAFALPQEASTTAAPSTNDAAQLASVYAVLITALPSSLAAIAATNQGELATILNSQINAGEATWFTQLPTDVQSYLAAVGASQYGLTINTASATGAATGAVTTGASAASGASSGATTPAATGSSNGTAVASASSHSSGASSHTGSSSAATGSRTASGSAASASRTASSSASTGGASMPTAVVGAGIAGALGFLGMLAL